MAGESDDEAGRAGAQRALQPTQPLPAPAAKPGSAANLPPPVETGTGKVFDMDARILTNGGGTFRGQTANKVALDIGFRSVQGQT